MSPLSKRTSPNQTTPTRKPTVAEGLINLEKSSKYQALPTEKKLEVRGHLYDKYVAPYLKTKGVDTSDPSTKEAWVKAGLGTPVKDLKRPGAPTAKEKLLDVGTHYYAQLGKGGVQTTRMLADLNQTALHFIVKNFPVRSLTPIENKLLDKYDRWMTVNKTKLNAREDFFNSYLGSNYNSTWMTKAAEIPAKVMTVGVKGLPYMVAGEVLSTTEGLLGAKSIGEMLLKGSASDKFIYKALKGAAEGYLGSAMQGESAKERKKSVGAFVGIESALALMPFLGRMIGLGGSKTLVSNVAAVVASSKDAIEKADISTIRGATVKATAKALNEVAVNLGFKDFWEAQSKGKGKEIIEGLMALSGQANKEVTVHNPELVAAEASKDFETISKHPMGANFLGMLKSEGSDLVKDTVGHTVEATKAASGAPLEKSTVGAAAASSLEFSDNLTKRIQTNIPFEKRQHKFLAALSLLFDEAKSKGGKMSKEDNELFNAIQNQLDQDPEFRNKTLQQRLEAGQEVHRHIDYIIKEGKPGTDGKKRFWRSTIVIPGETPTGVQKQLQAKVGAIEGAEHKVGDYVRLGNTKILGKVTEAYRGHVTIETPSGAKYSVSNKEVFSAGAKRTEIAEEYARRREQASKMLEMKKAEEKIAKRQQEKAAKEARQKEREAKKETKEEELNRRMREETQRVSGQDTFKLEDAIEQLFPGKDFSQLTSAERQQAIDLSLKKGKK